MNRDRLLILLVYLTWTYCSLQNVEWLVIDVVDETDEIVLSPAWEHPPIPPGGHASLRWSTLIAEQAAPFLLAATLFHHMGPPKRPKFDPKLLAELRELEKELEAQLGSSDLPPTEDNRRQ